MVVICRSTCIGVSSIPLSAISFLYINLSVLLIIVMYAKAVSAVSLLEASSIVSNNLIYSLFLKARPLNPFYVWFPYACKTLSC